MWSSLTWFPTSPKASLGSKKSDVWRDSIKSYSVKTQHRSFRHQKILNHDGEFWIPFLNILIWIFHFSDKSYSQMHNQRPPIPVEKCLDNLEGKSAVFSVTVRSVVLFVDIVASYIPTYNKLNPDSPAASLCLKSRDPTERYHPTDGKESHAAVKAVR